MQSLGVFSGILLAVFLGGAAGVAVEVVAEEGRAREVVPIGQFGGRDVGLQQVEAYLHNGIDVDGLLGRAAVALPLIPQ